MGGIKAQQLKNGIAPAMSYFFNLKITLLSFQTKQQKRGKLHVQQGLTSVCSALTSTEDMKCYNADMHSK